MNRKTILLTLIALLIMAGAALPAAAQTYINYVTQPDDTLSKIAAEFCTTWQAIYQINSQVIGPDPNVLVPGESLTIPAYCNFTPQPSGGVYDRGPQPNATGYVIPPSTYVVNWGDTITSIGERFGVDPNVIAQANGLANPNQIYYGEGLYIPGLNGGGYPPQPTPPPADSDGDTIPDYRDACPYEYGSPTFNGCPNPPPPGINTPVPQPSGDTDGDGVPDYRDTCPTQYGSPTFDGCPNPPPPGIITPVPSGNGDRDADGIPDSTDYCPDQFGVVQKNGCP